MLHVNIISLYHIQLYEFVLLLVLATSGCFSEWLLIWRFWKIW